MWSFVDKCDPQPSPIGFVATLVWSGVTAWLRASSSNARLPSAGPSNCAGNSLGTLCTFHSGFQRMAGNSLKARPFERLVDWRRIAVFLRNSEAFSGWAKTCWVHLCKACRNVSIRIICIDTGSKCVQFLTDTCLPDMFIPLLREVADASSILKNISEEAPDGFKLCHIGSCHFRCGGVLHPVARA